MSVIDIGVTLGGIVANWDSMEDVRKAAKVMLKSPVAQSVMQKIDSSSILCNFYEKVPLSNR